MKKYKNIFTVFCFSLFIVHSYAQDVPTQYEGGSVGQERITTTIEAEKARLIAQIEMGKKACSIVKEKEGKKAWRKCKKEKVSRPSLALTILEESELAQSVAKKQETKAELAQEDKNLDTKISEQAKRIDTKRKESAKKDLTIAALEALKKVKAKMQGKEK